jgi:hypothetical protein
MILEQEPERPVEHSSCRLVTSRPGKVVGFESEHDCCYETSRQHGFKFQRMMARKGL